MSIWAVKCHRTYFWGFVNTYQHILLFWNICYLLDITESLQELVQVVHVPHCTFPVVWSWAHNSFWRGKFKTSFVFLKMMKLCLLASWVSQMTARKTPPALLFYSLKMQINFEVHFLNSHLGGSKWKFHDSALWQQYITVGLPSPCWLVLFKKKSEILEEKPTYVYVLLWSILMYMYSYEAFLFQTMF